MTDKDPAEVAAEEIFNRYINECRDPYDGSLAGQDRVLKAMKDAIREAYSCRDNEVREAFEAARVNVDIGEPKSRFALFETSDDYLKYLQVKKK